MAIKSKYANKCKDCGTAYSVGDQIDTNGNESPNKAGEIKAHWCPLGKECQGVKLSKVSTDPSIDTNSQHITFAPAPSDPTPEQFLELGKAMLCMPDEDKSTFIAMLSVATDEKIGKELIKRSRIELAMNKVELQHPSRIAFIKDVLK